MRIDLPGLNAWLALLLLTCLPAAAQISPDDLLPVEDAFALEARAGENAVILRWQIADGYYLYRHAFRVDSTTEDTRLGEAVIPPGQETFDEFFGETETYRDLVEITVPLLERPADGHIELMVRSQGCADLGVCYPPHRQVVSVNLPVREAPPASALDGLLGRSPRGASGLLTNDPGVLPAEQAFSFEAIAGGPGSILVRFTARPDYYLYKHAFEFRIDDDEISVVRADLPPAQPIHDEFFGDTEVYFGEVEIPVHLSRPAGPRRSITLSADFQGCWENGICYPPMTRSLSVDLPASATDIRPDPAELVEPARPAAEQDRLAQALAGTPLLALSLFLLAGILLAFTPCVFPMVPILSGLIAGEGDRMTTGRAFRLSLVYVLAMALVYTAFGVIAGIFGQNLQALFQHPAILTSFAALFVLLSLAMFGFYELQLPPSWQTRLNEWSNRAEGGTLLGAAIMGALSALVVGPCVAPALMGALIYIGQTGDAVMGGAALFAMAIGMGIPLVVWGTSAGRLLPRAGAWMNAVKAVFGVGLLALAIWMLERVIPAAVTMLLWGGLAIACAVYLGALTRLPPDAPGWRKLWQGLGVMLLVFGAIQFVGALSGGNDWLRPLNHLRGGAVGSVESQPTFRRIDTLDELQAEIASARQPVFLDFYADWCVDCVRMERRTFPDPGVAARMREFSLIKIDVTDYTSDHQAILSHFGLIGPPAYLFFRDGEELRHLRSFGFMAPARFLNLLEEAG
ncbi:MAG: protein-disulfide reductase DsbD [Wenzhouxiangella sp.]|nr:MAG: protein-disulfide reductase DsbD [Wenzhouxiangella sp.]